VGRTLGRALPVGGEFAVGLEIADDDADGLLEDEGAVVAVGDGVVLGEGEAVSLVVGASVGAMIRSREARVGL
jgi:co-chaperonin GroES (HSP10)